MFAGQDVTAVASGLWVSTLYGEQVPNRPGGS
jgi:hypothetical protein